MVGNPLLNMMQNNPIMNMVNMLKNGGNPQQLVQQMMGQNPQFKNAVDMINGKNQNEISDIINKTAKEKGVDLSQLATQIGMPPEIAKKYGITID